MRIFYIFISLLTFIFTFSACEDKNEEINELLVLPEYVDLGLPSGTLWATWNIGATSPKEYGYYYAWGEIAPKRFYDWKTYKFCNGDNKSITKYMPKDYIEALKENITLEDNDDVAYVYWGKDWRMPTRLQFNELIEECDWVWTTLEGTNGYAVKSKVNGNSLFLPAAGGWYKDQFDGNGGSYWSKSLRSDVECAYILNFSATWIDAHTSVNRCLGLSIRPVQVPAE